MAKFLSLLNALLFSLFTLVSVSYGQASNTWLSAGQMTQARTAAAAVLLQDGRILITGGADANGVPTTSAEFFNPATGSFSAAPSMNVPRMNHAAIVLVTKDVLVTGGITDAGGDYTNTAEIFSASTQQWTQLPAILPQGFSGHAMALLADGNVLIAGGQSTTGPVSALLLFNATDDSITSVGTLMTARKNAAAAATPDGRVLIAGGTDINNNVLSSTEIFVYAPSTLTGTISAGPAMTYARTAATATATYDGVAVIGGYNIQNGTLTDLGTAEIFSQWTNAFRVVSGGTPRSGHFAVRLPNNGAILDMGGTSAQAVDLLEPWANATAGAFVAGSSSLSNQTGGFAAPATLGSILAAGGQGTAASDAELYWFPTIATDQPDYAPGTPVVMTGTGFQPGESVDLHLHEWVNQTVSDIPDYTVLAGSNGTFSFTGYAPTPTDLGARYHLTAIGETSALQAQTVFTDATATMTVITSGTNPSNSGASVTFTATVTYCNGGNGQTCSGGTVTPVPGGTVTFKTGTNNNCTGSGSAILASNVSLNGSGQATDTTSFTNPPSSINVCAIYSGFGSGANAFSGSNNFVSQVVSSTDATSTAVSSSTITYGQTAASTVTVTNLGGSTSPTGNVSMTVTGGGLASCTHVSSAASTSTFSCTINYSANGVADSPYTLTATFSHTGNFVDSSNTGTLTVNPTPLTAAVTGSQTYGGTNKSFTPVYSGFVNSENASAISGTLSCSTNAVATSPVSGSYSVSNCSGLTTTNYTISYSYGSFTVNPGQLTITVTGAQTYGGTDQLFTPSYSGFVNSETSSVISGTLTCGSTASSTSPVSGNPYKTSGCSGLTATNYTISYSYGSFAVNPAALSITASNGSFTYGGTVPTITPTLTTGSSFVGSDSFASLVGLTCSTTATSSSHVAGNSYPSSCSGSTDSNYTVSYVNGSVNVNPAALSLTASNGSFTYGGIVPTITPALTTGSSFVGSDSFASLGGLTCSTTATSTSHVAGNPYTSSCSGATDGDYSISYVNGSVTVIAAPLSITASSGSFTYGDTVPTITPNYSGFVNGDTAASLMTQATCSTMATSTSHVASNPYSSSCSGATDSDYSISYVNGTVNVNPKPVTLTAGGLAATTYDGNTHALSTCASSASTFVTCANSPLGPVGPDVTSGAQTVTPTPTYVQGDAGDYAITPDNGSYEIDKLAVTLTAGSYGPAAYDGSNHDISACTSSSGLLSCTNNPAGPVGPNVGGTAVTPTPVYGSAIAGDFAITNKNGSWSITPALVTATAGSLSGTYNGSAQNVSICVVTGTYTGTVTCTNSPASNTEAGSGTVTPVVSYGTDASTNYTLTPVTGMWSIAKATPTLSLTCTEVIFDGNPHSCVGSATGIGGTAVSGTWIYSPASETKPGSYPTTGTFTSADPNYASGSTSGTLVIDHWRVTGFYSPVVPTTGTVVWNVIKGGSTVPLKFNIYAGTVPQTTTLAVRGGTVMVYPANCNVGGWSNTATDLLVDTGATALRYDTTGLQFIQNWKTPKGSGCYVAQMTAADGTSILAYFTAN